MSEEYNFLGSKVVDYGEIVVCFFEHCNLRCVFCPQDHDSTLGASREEILEKVPRITHWINSNKKSLYFKLHLMGGELFQDYWLERGFLEIYQEFLDSVREGVDPKKTVVFNFITNLVFNESSCDQIKNFIVRNGLKISISYDPSGRFNGPQKNTFLANVKALSNYIEMVSVVLTRGNIKAIMRGDETLELLHGQFTIDFDHFLPSVESSDQLLPYDSEKQAFYKFLVDKYPNCLNVEPFMADEKVRRMTCTRGNSLTIMSGRDEVSGCSGSVFLKGGDFDYLEKPKIVENYLQKYDCLTCDYYKKCPFSCFISESYDSPKRDLEDCIFKDVFRYAESKKA